LPAGKKETGAGITEAGQQERRAAFQGLDDPAPLSTKRKDMINLITYRPPRIAIALLAAATVLWHLSPPETIIHLPYKLIGTICIPVGFAVLLVAWLQFKKANAAISPTAESPLIVTSGIYRYTRNPMYLGMLLMLLGSAFFMGTITAMLAPVIFFLIIDKVFIPYEEDKLLTSFGDSYNEYLRTTRRWL
jgi:protein-S-isoprenylcysteine O-methyltransferase Ste14